MRPRWLPAVAILGLVTWSAVAHPWGWLYGLGVHPYPESSSTPWTYQLWSGFLPALTVLGLLGSAVGLYRHANCSVHLCPRISRYAIAGGQFKVCRKHHPSAGIRDGHVTVEHVKLSHDSWRQDGGP